MAHFKTSRKLMCFDIIGAVAMVTALPAVPPGLAKERERKMNQFANSEKIERRKKETAFK